MISVLRHCLLLLCFFASAVYAWQPQQGDIIFHTSRTSQSLAIQKATGSVYSHMGIIPVSYTHLTLPTKEDECRSRWSPSH